MSEKLLPSNENIEFIKNYNYEQKDRDIRFTSIILLTYNKLEYTKICIESIRKFTPKGKYEIIVVDNNSNDGTQDWLNKQDDLKVIYNNYNAGFPKGCNQGIEISRGDSILLLNNDTVVTPNWLNVLDKTLYSNNKIGAVGSITNSCSNGQAINVNYNDLEGLIEFGKELNKYNESLHELKMVLIGYCFLVKRSVIDKVGLLDEIFTPGNFEDNDLSFRILENGYDLVLCRDSFIHHYGSTSFKQDVQGYNTVYHTNFFKFTNKWGFDLHSTCITRLDLLNMMQSNSNDYINILDIGCATGDTLLAIRNRYKNAKVYGIEKNENKGKIAKGIANTIIGDVEQIDFLYEEKYFDYIILGDILEQLKDPWNLLNKLKIYLKDGGLLLCSIRNIMQIKVLRQILTGNFTYSGYGVLSKDNLRFFTGYEMQKMIQESGFKINGLYAQNLPILPEEEELINQLCKINGEGYRQQYLTYQYLIKASKIE